MFVLWATYRDAHWEVATPFYYDDEVRFTSLWVHLAAWGTRRGKTLRRVKMGEEVHLSADAFVQAKNDGRVVYNDSI